MIKRLSSLKRSVKERIIYGKLGIFFFRYSGLVLPPYKILHRFRYRVLATPDNNSKLGWEFNSIFKDDCYHLRNIKGNVYNIVDIGANLGYFSIHARRVFPRARILAFEPNPDLKKYLLQNSQTFGFEYRALAVGSENTRVNLIFTDNILTTQTKVESTGEIEMVSLKTIVNEMGSIDILKMDCEGGEWEIFKSTDIFRRVKYITMEYHIWANPSQTPETITDFFVKNGFALHSIIPLDENWGMLFAQNKNYIS